MTVYAEELADKIRTIMADHRSMSYAAKELGITKERASKLLNPIPRKSQLDSETDLLRYKKASARNKLNYRIKKGFIVKPEVCSHCNETLPVYAHHHDYDLPLDVIWVCRQCHEDIHHKQ